MLARGAVHESRVDLHASVSVIGGVGGLLATVQL